MHVPFLLLLFNIFIYVGSGSQLSGSKSVDVFLSWNAQVVVFISLIPTGIHKTEIFLLMEQRSLKCNA